MAAFEEWDLKVVKLRGKGLAYFWSAWTFLTPERLVFVTF
jgi:hypothetical protein